MKTLPTEPVTLDSFIAWESEQEVRHELVDGRISLMPGVTAAHSLIAIAVVSALRAHLRRGPCRAHAGEMMLDTGRGIRYTDGLVTCDERDRNPIARTIRYPKLIVEVLSKSTASVDRGPKLDEYRAMPSVEEYALIDSCKRWACTYRRVAGDWIASLPVAAGELRLESIDLALDLDDLYAEAEVGT